MQKTTINKEAYQKVIHNIFTKEKILSIIDEIMPTSLKNYVKNEAIQINFLSQEEMDEIKEDSPEGELDVTYAYYVSEMSFDETSVDEEGYADVTIEKFILLYYKNIVDILYEDDLELIRNTRYHCSKEYLIKLLDIDESLIPNELDREFLFKIIEHVLYYNLYLSFFHELGHAIDNTLSYIFTEVIECDEEQNAYKIPNYSELDMTFSQLVTEYNLTVEGAFSLDENKQPYYRKDEIVKEIFAELFGLFILYKELNYDVIQNDEMKLILNDDFLLYFKHILSMIEEDNY